MPHTIGIDIRSLMHHEAAGVGSYTTSLLSAVFQYDTETQYQLFYNSKKPVLLPRFDFKTVSYKGYTYPNKLFNAGQILGTPKINTLLPDCDVFFLPNLHFAQFSKNTPYVLTIHDLSFELFPEFYSPKQRAWHRLIQPKKLAQNAAHIIAVSKNTKQDIIDLYNIPEEKISVIHSGIDPHFTPLAQDAPEAKKVKTLYGLPDSFLLFLGTIEPRKNIESLIEAFDMIKASGKYPNLKLVLVGGKGWNNKHIYKIIESAVFRGDIIFTGYIPQEHKQALYSLATVFVFPSYYEGFGFPPLEAQACGTPVIASTAGSLPEVLGNSALLIHPSYVNELGHALQTLLDSPSLQNQYRKKGIENSAQFNWDSTAKKTLTILKKP